MVSPYWDIVPRVVFVRPLALFPANLCSQWQSRRFGRINGSDRLPLVAFMSVPHRRTGRAAVLEQRRKPGARWGSVFFTVIAVIGSLHAMFMLTRESGLLIYTHREVARLEADIGKLQREIRTLQAVIDHKDDPVFREQLARQQGFIYPDETRILTRRP